MDARTSSSICSSLVPSTAPRSQVATRVHRGANANRKRLGTALNSGSFAGVKLTAASSTRVVSPSRANAVSVSAEISYVMIKPDGVQRGLVGEIISRFERKGFTLKGLKLFKCTQDLAEEHYGELKTKKFFPALVEYIISGPVVCMVWEGDGVVASARKLIGKTDPLEAEPGTIRGDFAVHKGRNVVHGSDSIDNGVRETGLWFDDDEIMTWEPTLTPWIVE